MHSGNQGCLRFALRCPRRLVAKAFRVPHRRPWQDPLRRNSASAGRLGPNSCPSLSDVEVTRFIQWHRPDLPDGEKARNHLNTLAKLSPEAQIEMFPRLERFDVEFDLPEAFIPEFPPAIFLIGRPEAAGGVVGEAGRAAER